MVRLIEASMHRQLAAAQQRLAQERTEWWVARISYAADALDVDPVQLAQEVRGRPWVIVLPLDREWPVGLRREDEPQIRYDQRYGRRRRMDT